MQFSFKRCLVGCALGLASLAAVAQGSKPPSPASPRTIDWFSLLESFALPAAANYNVADWATNARSGGPIRWQTDGVASTLQGLERRGTAVVTIRGKPVQMLGRTSAPHAWQVVLLGSRAGYDRVELRSNMNHPELDEFDVPAELKRRGVPLRRLKCSDPGMATFQVYLYEVSSRSKQPFWVLHSRSCGSAGCGVDLTMFLQPPDASVAAEHQLGACPS